ncbi:MAG: enoyl-CoA hydratase [Proteobacteria bacterium]|nr:enoyl-CoA hydratase [Pseudomonadota bacterium]
MDYKTILFEERDSLAIVHLNRPDKLNAFNQQMLHDLLDVLDTVDKKDNIKALIITGSGKAFCAGADLSSGKDTFKHEFKNSDKSHHGFNRDSGGILVLRMYKCLKPILTACNGVAVGVGATLQLAADIRTASTNARWFLPKIVGISKALEWSYSGEIFDASVAKESRLITYLFKPEDMLRETIKLAHKLIDESSQVSVALTRQMMWTLSSSSSPYDAHEIDSQVIQSRGSSDDAVEGVMSFLEKRKAHFPNKISADMPFVFPWTKNKFDEE